MENFDQMSPEQQLHALRNVITGMGQQIESQRGQIDAQGLALAEQESVNEELRGQISANTVRKPHRIKIRDFDGKTEDWMTWKKHFLSAVANNGLTTQEKIRQLHCSLSAKASLFVSDINIEDGWINGTFEAYLAKVEERFNPLAKKIQAQAIYSAAKQTANESLEVWHNTVRALHLAAYPETHHFAHGEVEMTRKFVQGLYNDSIRLDILKMQPTTIAAALTAGANMISFKMQEELMRTGTLSTSAQGTAKRILGDGSPEDFGMGSMVREPGREAAPREESMAAMQFQRRRDGKSKKDDVCYNCDKKGHHAKECRAPKKERASGRPQQSQSQKQKPRGPALPRGGKKTERPSGKGGKFHPAKGGIHAIQEESQATREEAQQPCDEESSGEE